MIRIFTNFKIDWKAENIQAWNQLDQKTQQKHLKNIIGFQGLQDLDLLFGGRGQIEFISVDNPKCKICNIQLGDISLIEDNKIPIRSFHKIKNPSNDKMENYDDAYCKKCFEIFMIKK